MRPHTITYPPDGVEPIGVIEFVHGMCETRNRYAAPMEYFSRHGYICAIADMRGHGENILTTDDLGYFGEEGYKGLVNDVQEYTMYLKREFPNLPFILLGHSMGSLVVRTYLKKYSQEVDAVILSGSPSENSLAAAGKFLAKFLAFFRGWHYRSPFIENMVNGPFEKPFLKEGIVNSWLSTDKFIVEEYNKDPLCGVPFTLNGYYCLFSLIVSLDCSILILKPVISPSSATSRVLQKIVGHPSFFISGAANCVNVSLIMITCVMLLNSSRNSLAPGIGSICAIVC